MRLQRRSCGRSKTKALTRNGRPSTSPPSSANLRLRSPSKNTKPRTAVNGPGLFLSTVSPAAPRAHDLARGHVQLANPLSIDVGIHCDVGGALNSEKVVGLECGLGGGCRGWRDIAAARFIRVIRTAGWRDAALELLEARTATVAHGNPLLVTGGRGDDRSESPCAAAMAKH